jgi:hypothetical protein
MSEKFIEIIKKWCVERIHAPMVQIHEALASADWTQKVITILVGTPYEVTFIGFFDKVHYQIGDGGMSRVIN